ncbi:MAG: glycosyltransferase [Microthrixaceae bacterium]
MTDVPLTPADGAVDGRPSHPFTAPRGLAWSDEARHRLRSLTPTDPGSGRVHTVPTPRPPIVSVLTPVYNTPVGVLAECIASVTAQTYERWELCLVDDASPSAGPWDELQRWAALDDRIRIARRNRNGGIVAASNDCAALATGEIVSLLDHDDMLAPHALDRVVEAFGAGADVDYVYSDEDLVHPVAGRISPFYKPDWSPERFRGQMYCCHLSSIRRSLFDDVGGFREGFDGSQDWDLMWRVAERARRIVHIPEVLYHWRIVETSVLAGESVKPYAYDAARRVLEEHCARVGIRGEVVESERRGHFRVRRDVEAEPLTSIVVPTRGDRGVVFGERRTMVVEAVRSVLQRSTWTELEIVVVADTATPDAVLDELLAIGGDRLRIVEWSGPFDFSAKCNLGAAVAHGELLVFLNDDTEVITADWLDTMSGFLREPDVGAVGPHLLFEDGRLQCGGHVLIGGNPGHLMFGQDPHSERNRMALWLDREVAGVTAACLMTRATTFAEVGGFSPDLPGNYNDVDLCLKLRDAGYRVIATPHARLYHFESISRDPTVSDRELATLRARWQVELSSDPYYSIRHLDGLDCYPEPVGYPAVSG